MACQHQCGLRAPPSGVGIRGEMAEDMDLEHSYWDGDEEVLASNEGSEEDRRFDSIVGALEEAVLDPAFATTQQTFIDEWCEEFDETEENKLIYTDLFQQYTQRVERHLDEWLRQRISGFSVEAFMKMATEREDEIVGDVFDMLMAVGNFNEFKRMMLAHRAGRKCGMANAGACAGGSTRRLSDDSQKNSTLATMNDGAYRGESKR